MKRIITSIAVLGLLVFATPVAAVDVFQPCNDPAFAGANPSICQQTGGTTKLFGPGSIWNRILNALTYVVGAISVLMIIIGAVRYALSSGDQNGITSAKNTIIYALVALIVAVMANALVNFVLTNI